VFLIPHLIAITLAFAVLGIPIALFRLLWRVGGSKLRRDKQLLSLPYDIA
jgi:hypothetical protein